MINITVTVNTSMITCDPFCKNQDKVLKPSYEIILHHFNLS